jgi:HPt (histidine-containing phosphotransfer) domain-containing protein
MGMIPLVDRDELDSQTFRDGDIRREVIGMFRDQMPAILGALAAGEGVARAEIAHRLKGSALALGAKPLAEAASRLEASPADPAALAEVRALADATLQALLALLDR